MYITQFLGTDTYTTQEYKYTVYILVIVVTIVEFFITIL